MRTGKIPWEKRQGSLNRDPGAYCTETILPKPRQSREGVVQRSAADKEPPPDRGRPHIAFASGPSCKPWHTYVRASWSRRGPQATALGAAPPGLVAFDLEPAVPTWRPAARRRQQLSDDLLLRDDFGFRTRAPARSRDSRRPPARLAHETRNSPLTPPTLSLPGPHPLRAPPSGVVVALRLPAARRPISRALPLAGSLLSPRGPGFAGGRSGRSARPAPARLVTLHHPARRFRMGLKSLPGRAGGATAREEGAAAATVAAGALAPRRPRQAGLGASNTRSYRRARGSHRKHEAEFQAIVLPCGSRLPCGCLASPKSPWPRRGKQKT